MGINSLNLDELIPGESYYSDDLCLTRSYFILDRVSCGNYKKLYFKELLFLEKDILRHTLCRCFSAVDGAKYFKCDLNKIKAEAL